MSEAEVFGLKNAIRPPEKAQDAPHRTASAQFAERKSSAAPAAPVEQTSHLQRVLGALRKAAPLILPLLDGNVASSVSNLLMPQPQAPPQPPPINLERIENSLAELAAQHDELRGHLFKQNDAIRRVEDQLELLRQAADHTANQQHELLDGLKSLARKVNIFAFVTFVLLAVSIAMNVLLTVHLREILHLH